jgi:hypothetical protein
MAIIKSKGKGVGGGDSTVIFDFGRRKNSIVHVQQRKEEQKQQRRKQRERESARKREIER